MSYASRQLFEVIKLKLEGFCSCFWRGFGIFPIRTGGEIHTFLLPNPAEGRRGDILGCVGAFSAFRENAAMKQAALASHAENSPASPSHNPPWSQLCVGMSAIRQKHNKQQSTNNTRIRRPKSGRGIEHDDDDQTCEMVLLSSGDPFKQTVLSSQCLPAGRILNCKSHFVAQHRGWIKVRMSFLTARGKKLLWSLGRRRGTRPGTQPGGNPATLRIYLVFCIGLQRHNSRQGADRFNNRPFVGTDEIFKPFLNLHSSAVGMEPHPINAATRWSPAWNENAANEQHLGSGVSDH